MYGAFSMHYKISSSTFTPYILRIKFNPIQVQQIAQFKQMKIIDNVTRKATCTTYIFVPSGNKYYKGKYEIQYFLLQVPIIYVLCVL